MFTVLLFGFLLGMQHAMEADHVAAVASLASRSPSVRQTATQGAVWGLGHALALFVFGGMVLLLDGVVPQRFAQGLELAVGFMLVVLGMDVLRRVARDRIHFHRHQHGAAVHMHAHSHREGGDHGSDPHRHDHPSPLRALLVGLMHGMAGSAALIILTLNAVESLLQGLVYILLFGTGSILGMAVLAAVISLPLKYSARSLTWAHNGLQALVGVVTVGLGGTLVYQLGFAAGLLRLY
jgi:ABC-type nickel/cobalt efflux system permease component RcnA